jgi:Flp pilus assembly protein TadG
MTARLHRALDWLAAYRRNTRGAAAAEIGLVAAILAIPMVNITDLGMYAYQKMQVENAAAAGAEAAWSTCHTGTLPATQTGNCSGLSAAVTTAIQSTSLGANVTQATGSPAEGYYCVLTTGLLSKVSTGGGTLGNPPTGAPATCDSVASHSAVAGTPPADYVSITVTYTYTPVFSGVSVVSLLPSPITKTTMTRLI